MPRTSMSVLELHEAIKVSLDRADSDKRQKVYALLMREATKIKNQMTNDRVARRGGHDTTDVHILKQPQEPQPEPCDKDAGCVQAAGRPYLTNVDYNCADQKRHTLCCLECYPSMEAKHGVFASYGKVFEGACTYCGKEIKPIHTKGEA